MSCYHPMVAVRDYGDKQYKLLGSVPDIDFLKTESSHRYKETLLVPCGQCRGCRYDKSRTWADRMCLEFDHTKKAVFLTLTYDPDHLPLSGVVDWSTGECFPTLVKEDMSRFMKDLRGNKHFDGKELRFYGSGEYGEKFGRSHMHIILFGASLEDFDWPLENSGLVLHDMNELHQPTYRSRILEEVIWKKGLVGISDFSWETAAYVARYVRKKLTGDLESVYTCRGQVPPFSLMSRRPGIAGYYLLDHPDKDIFEVDTFSVNGKIKRIPDYLFDRLVSDNPQLQDKFESFKNDRRRYANDRMMSELSQTNLSMEELLAIKERTFVSKTNSLSRPLE